MADGMGNAVVVFDDSHAITGVTDVAPLEIFAVGVWTPCDVVLDFDAHSITLQCSAAIESGWAWRVLTPMGVEWDNDPAIVMSVPESGTVSPSP